MLTILGATGYTGRLCADEAVRRGLPVRLAGRRRAALEALAAEVGGGAAVAVADAGDPRGLKALAAGSDAVLTTVGPYARRGRPVLEAALESRADYLDVSGEVAFLDWAHRQDDRARAAGVTACPGVGFDGLTGELLAGMAAARLGGAVDRVRVAYAVAHGRASAGTIRSVLGIAAHGGAAWVDGQLVAEPVGAARWRAPFPGGARPTISAPLPEVVTVGRSTGAATVRTFTAAPAGGLIAATARPGTALLGALVRTPAWSPLEQAVGLLPAGPAPDRRARTIATVVVGVDGPAGGLTAWARVADVYAVTARLAVDVAARLLDGRLRRHGVLTPTQALGPQAADLLAEVGAATGWG